MKNGDLKRFYPDDGNFDPKDFARLDKDGKIPADLLPEMGVTILELSEMSGTLTDEQYELASGDNCVIVLGTQYYYKMYDAATLIVYQTATRQAGQDSALYEYIEITKATKEWEYKNDNIVKGNPTIPEGTTPTDLSNIRIGNTYFAIPQGGGEQLYQHTVNLYNTNNVYALFQAIITIISNSSIALTKTDLRNYLQTYSESIYSYMECTGWFKDVSATTYSPILAATWGGSDIMFKGLGASNLIPSSFNINDTVIQIL